jgi:hypothetical protein
MQHESQSSDVSETTPVKSAGDTVTLSEGQEMAKYLIGTVTTDTGRQRDPIAHVTGLSGDTLGEEFQRRRDETASQLRELRQERDEHRENDATVRASAETPLNKFLGTFDPRFADELKNISEDERTLADEAHTAATDLKEKHAFHERNMQPREISEAAYARVLKPLNEYVNTYIPPNEQQAEREMKVDVKDLYAALYSQVPDIDQGRKPIGDVVFGRLEAALLRSPEVDGGKLVQATRDLLIADSTMEGTLVESRLESVLHMLPALANGATPEEMEFLGAKLGASISQEWLSTVLHNSEKVRALATPLSFIVRKGDSRVRQGIKECLREALDSRGDDGVDEDAQNKIQQDGYLLDAFSRFTYEHDWKSMDFCEDVLGDVFMETVGEYVHDRYGLDPNIARTWRGNGKYSLDDNLYAIERLEAIGEHGAEVLREAYGIREFHRYPIELLEQQLATHGQDVPYGLLFFSHSDSDKNNAMDEAGEVLRTLMQETNGKHVPRVVEVGSGTAMLRKLSYLRHTYKEKIAFLVNAMHGAPTEVELDDKWFSGSQFQHITMEQINDSRALDQIKDMFVEDPPIIMCSCSTGGEGRFAQALSDRLGGHTVAPTVPAGLKSITATYDELGKIDLDAVFDIKATEHYRYVSKVARSVRPGESAGNV